MLKIPIFSLETTKLSATTKSAVRTSLTSCRRSPSCGKALGNHQCENLRSATPSTPLTSCRRSPSCSKALGNHQCKNLSLATPSTPLTSCLSHTLMLLEKNQMVIKLYLQILKSNISSHRSI